MAGLVKMATLSELPPGAAKEVEHEGRIYALFNVGGVISAIDGICPHQGGPLAEGPPTKMPTAEGPAVLTDGDHAGDGWQPEPDLSEVPPWER